MVRRSSRLGSPAEQFPDGFPDGQLAPEAPVAARYVQQLVMNLRVALAGRSLSAVGRDAGLARSTLQALLAGDSWPDLVTIARLEEALDVTLWPGRDAVR